MPTNHPDWRAVAELTGRQREILHGICQGKRNATIGRELGISPQTVKNHITAILAKTGSRDRAHAAYLFARWEQVQHAKAIGSQVDVPMDSGVMLSFRALIPNRLVIRIGRSDARADLFELSAAATRDVRSLLLANIDDDSCQTEEACTPGEGDEG